MALSLRTQDYISKIVGLLVYNTSSIFKSALKGEIDLSAFQTVDRKSAMKSSSSNNNLKSSLVPIWPQMTLGYK